MSCNENLKIGLRRPEMPEEGTLEKTNEPKEESSQSGEVSSQSSTIPPPSSGQIGAIDAIHKAMIHSGDATVPLTGKQFLWGLRYINFKRKTNQTQQELMEQQMHPMAGPELVKDLRFYLQFASSCEI